MLLPILVGALLGVVVGFGVRDTGNRPKSLMTALLLAALFACVTLIGMVPGLVALAFFGGTAVTSVGAIMLPDNNLVARFFRRAME